MSKLRLSIGLCLLLALVGEAPATWSQEVRHAPTMDRCRADQALWGSLHARTEYNEAEARHINDDAPNRTDIASVTIPQLQARMREMYECEDVVAAEPFHETGNFYHDAIMDRYAGFLRRRGLMWQVMKEDAQGQR